MKEIWIELWQSAYDEAIERGLSEKEADAFACQAAESGSADYLAELIDEARQRRKDGLL